MCILLNIWSTYFNQCIKLKTCFGVNVTDNVRASHILIDIDSLAKLHISHILQNICVRSVLYKKWYKMTKNWWVSVFPSAPVSSVLLVSECLSQGQMRVSCSSEGGDSPQYSWTLDGLTLTDAELLSGNTETNNITLKQHVSGTLVCSVRNDVSSVSKEEKISDCGEWGHEETAVWCLGHWSLTAHHVFVSLCRQQLVPEKLRPPLWVSRLRKWRRPL